MRGTRAKLTGPPPADITEDDDDDDDDDDTEQEKVVKTAGGSGAKGGAQAPVPKESPALEAAREKKAAAEKELDAFKDDERFDEKVASEVNLIANETGAPALSSFLGEIRRDVRKFAEPSYSQHLEKKLDAAEQKVKELEAELASEQSGAKSSAKPTEKKTDAKDDVEKQDTVKSDHKGAKEAATSQADAVAQKAGETWAISFFANVAMLTVIFAMAAATNDLVRNYTWFLIDQVVAIFLAVMYFQAFDSFLDYAFSGVHNAVMVSILHAVLLLAMVLVLAYSLRRNSVGLAILCGAGAHIVSFSSIHAAASMQNMWVGLSYSWVMCIFGLLVLGMGLGIVGYLVYTAKKRAGMLENNDEFMDKTDDLENDFGAMAFSVCFTMFVRFLLTGHHPADDETEFDHTASQRTRMLLYACVCFLIAGVSVKFCAQTAAATKNYAVKRVMAFLTTVATMNVAWAFLYWGEWQFFEYLFPGEAIKGRVMFSILTTFCGGLGLLALTKVPSPEGKAGVAAKSEKMVALTALSLVVAWSWELCFDAAVEDMTEGVSHPAGWKIATTLSLFAIILPVYALYMKPITGPAAEAIGA